MEQFIGCDAHKNFSVFVAVNEKGNAGEALRLRHERQLVREFLGRLPPHSSIAVEASGHYSWLVDEMERLGHSPKLANPLEAKRRMGLTKKTDKLDAQGLAILPRNGTLPEVWIPPSELRDQRELLACESFWCIYEHESRIVSTGHWRDTTCWCPAPICSVWRLGCGSRRGYRSCPCTVVRPSSANWRRWISWRPKSKPPKNSWKAS